MLAAIHELKDFMTAGLTCIQEKRSCFPPDANWKSACFESTGFRQPVDSKNSGNLDMLNAPPVWPWTQVRNVGSLSVEERRLWEYVSSADSVKMPLVARRRMRRWTRRGSAPVRSEISSTVRVDSEENASITFKWRIERRAA